VVEGKPRELTTIDLFELKAAEFERTHPKEAKIMWGEIYDWGATAIEDCSLKNAIVAQIELRIEERRLSGKPITPEQFIEELFCPDCRGEVVAETITSRLQIG
jgi:hypothetical protein